MLFDKKFENALIEYAKREALGDYTLLKESIPFVNEMVRSLEAHYKGDKSRDEVVNYLKNRLADKEGYLGTWVGFEPNLFDRKDNQYVDEEHSDSNGRFVPYCYRDESREIKVMPLENIDKEEFYFLTKEKGDLTILDPFTYEIDGEDTLMTCVAKPIKLEKDTIGVTGVDIQLKSAKEIYHELIYYKTGLEMESTEYLEDILGGKGNKTKRVLGYTIKALVGNHQEILSELKKSSDTLIGNAKKLYSTSEDTRHASEELAKTTERLTSKVTEQSDHTEETSKNMDELNKVVQKNTKVLEELNYIIKEAINAKKEGEESVDSLQERTEDIQDIVNQIKLLALNASVEAAWAGKEGRGFAVIASEISDLSNRSYEALDNVMKVMEDIQNKFGSISGVIDQIETAVNRVSEEGESIKEIESSTVKKIQELSAIAEENASYSEEASSVAEEQSNASEELEHIAKELYKTVNSLMETLHKLSK